MDRVRKHRRAAGLVASLVLVAGIGAWFLLLLSDDGDLSMGYFGPDKQHQWAQQLVAGLNTHDAEQVPLLRISGKQLTAQKVAIAAVMPAPGCQYELVSVEDRGEQGLNDVPGLTGQNPTYRFDMTVKEFCAGQPTQTRDIGVVAIAEMGYWEPYHFVVD